MSEHIDFTAWRGQVFGKRKLRDLQGKLIGEVTDSVDVSPQCGLRYFTATASFIFIRTGACALS